MGFGSTGHRLTVLVTSRGDLIPMREVLGFPALQQAFLFGFVETRMGCCRAPGIPSYHRLYAPCMLPFIHRVGFWWGNVPLKSPDYTLGPYQLFGIRTEEAFGTWLTFELHSAVNGG
jgi:hypothetical protein